MFDAATIRSIAVADAHRWLFWWSLLVEVCILVVVVAVVVVFFADFGVGGDGGGSVSFC